MYTAFFLSIKYTVQSRKFERSYFEFPVVSNSKSFSLALPFNHFLSFISNFRNPFESFLVFRESSKFWGPAGSVNSKLTLKI